MQSSSWLLVVFVALTGTRSGNTAKSVFAASTSQCSSVATCYAGGASSTPCTVSDGGCPPCVTFADDGCYVKMNGACPFGSDCTSVWAGASTSTSDDSTTPSTIPRSSDDSMPSTSTTTPSTSPTTPSTSPTTSSTSPTTPSTTPMTPSTSTTTPSTTTSLPSTTAKLSSKSSSDMGDMFSSSTSSSSSNSGDLEAGKTGSSDMSVVFAIIGAAIGVIAVAVIFLTLVRRSNAAHDEDEDDISNPLAFSKGPMVQTSHNTTGAATYSSYNGTLGMVSGIGDEVGNEASKGVSMNAVSYYNQQPMQNSAAPSSHVAGRAIPSQPVGMNASSSMARPYGGGQNFGVTGVGVTSGFGTSGFGQSGVGFNNQAPLTPMQHVPMGSVAPSPQSRRESYEF
ncbi:unnamed protein product [Peronospora destructor]|uniref:Uncharacterized protein n=1 Tax=Peronospora destructor TaxID=86335 RepID=A0AAV0TM85_9STRA|nr:unnamed protein product [Peronospora destructor]